MMKLRSGKQMKKQNMDFNSNDMTGKGTPRSRSGSNSTDEMDSNLDDTVVDTSGKSDAHGDLIRNLMNMMQKMDERNGQLYNFVRNMEDRQNKLAIFVENVNVTQSELAKQVVSIKNTMLQVTGGTAGGICGQLGALDSAESVSIPGSSQKQLDAVRNSRLLGTNRCARDRGASGGA